MQTNRINLFGDSSEVLKIKEEENFNLDLG
jgi:hypothetical protein